MNIVVIILGIVVIILIYYLYTTYFTTSPKLSAYVDLKVSTSPISNTSLVKSTSTRYAYGMWVYVNSYNTPTLKTLISRTIKSGQNTTTDFSLQIKGTTPTLQYIIGPETASTQVTDNFPIQKWTYVIISVDNNIVDVYLDGKLVQSRQLSYTPTVSTADITIGDSSKPDIFLASLTRWPNPMDPQTAWNYYLQGTGVSTSSTGSNLKLSILQDNITQRTYSLY